MKTHYFHAKLSCQKPMLRQIEWWVQNRPITKNGVLPVNTSFFWKFCFSIRTCFKEFNWSTNCPNVRIHTFRRRWSFICGCFFPVSILKGYDNETTKIAEVPNFPILPYTWNRKLESRRKFFHGTIQIFHYWGALQYFLCFCQRRCFVCCS